MGERWCVPSCPVRLVEDVVPAGAAALDVDFLGHWWRLLGVLVELKQRTNAVFLVYFELNWDRERQRSPTRVAA